MSERGLRSILQPVLFLGIALILHGILFLIPAGEPTKRDAETTRGVRVKAYVDRSSDEVLPARVPRPPEAARDRQFSALENRTTNGESGALGIQHSGSGAQGAATAGESAASPTPGQGGHEPPPESDFGRYVRGLRSADVQGWAKESARRAQQGWKGAGTGRGKGSRTVESGSGKGASGTGSGGDGALFMDPRVRMIVTSYPSTGIEKGYSPVKYPDLKFKKHEYRSGWWNVYIEIRTDSKGKVIKSDVLRPETDGPIERQFVTQVKKEIDTWSFDPKEAEIHVDVRFYVE